MSGKFVARNFSTRSISNYVSISENLDGLRSDRNDIKGKLLHKLKESEFFPIISFHSNLIRVCCSRCYCIFHGRALFSNFYCLNFVFKIFRKFRDISVKSTKYSLFKHPRRRGNILMILKKNFALSYYGDNVDIQVSEAGFLVFLFNAFQQISEGIFSFVLSDVILFLHH